MSYDDLYKPTYLLTWNPDRYRWTDYEEVCEMTRNGTYTYLTDWSCRSRHPKEGDSFLLLLQGQKEKNGIVGYGAFQSDPCKYDFETDFGNIFADIKIERLWNYNRDEYVKTSELKEKFPDQCWVPQFSGIRVKSAILPDLWAMIKGLGK